MRFNQYTGKLTGKKMITHFFRNMTLFNRTKLCDIITKKTRAHVVVLTRAPRVCRTGLKSKVAVAQEATSFGGLEDKIPLNAVECEPVPTWVLNPNASEASY